MKTFKDIEFEPHTTGEGLMGRLFFPNGTTQENYPKAIDSISCFQTWHHIYLTNNLLTMAKKKSDTLTLSTLIDRHSINKAHLASKMEMPVGTFKNKLNEKLTQYRFSEDEENRLKEILLDMAADIQEVAGMTFNEALKKIVK